MEPGSKARPVDLAGFVLVVAATACAAPQSDGAVPASLQSAQETSVPQAVLERSTTLTVSLTMQPVPVEAGLGPHTLRSLLLHVPQMRVEPHAIWPNGARQSANARITQGEAEAVLRVLGQDRFFSQAARFRSQRRTTRVAPPEGRDGTAAPNPAAHVRIDVTVHDDDWYRVYIHDVIWRQDGRELLRRIRIQLQGPGGRLLDELIDQMPPDSTSIPSLPEN